MRNEDQINEYVAFGTFIGADDDDDERGVLSLLVSSEIDQVKNHIDRRSSSNEYDLDDYETPTDILTEVGLGIWHFYGQLRTYYELAGLVTFMSNTMSTSFFKSEIAEYANSNLPVAMDHEGSRIYGMDSGQLSIINKKIDRWSDISTGLKRLSPSILLSLVSTYDSAFSDFARVLLKSKPQRYSGSEKQYTVSEILKMNSLEDIVKRVVDDEIDTLMNKSHTDQISYFEKSFNISIMKNYERWGDFIEIFERRNIAAHGSLKVNNRYIENCISAGCEKSDLSIGDKLKVDRDYLENCIDTLLEFGILLALSAWQKQLPQEVEASFDAIVEVSFNILKYDRTIVAERILEYAISLKKDGCPDATKKRMIVNLAIAQKMRDKNFDISKTLSQTDWSASDFSFKTCVAALEEKVDEVCNLIPIVKAAGVLGIDAFRDWPAFRWIRGNESFQKAVEAAFGEPLQVTTATRTLPQKDVGDGQLH